jgi:hypothetical protein
MTVHTQHQDFSIPRHHEFLPGFFTLFDILQFTDMMDFKVAFRCIAVFTSNLP